MRPGFCATRHLIMQDKAVKKHKIDIGNIDNDRVF